MNKNGNYGFVKVATAIFDIRIGNVKENMENIRSCIDKATKEEVSLLVFPELCLTGYSCQDMFFNRKLITDVENALFRIAMYNNGCNTTCVIGAPIVNNGKLYNCAVVIDGCDIVAVIPKTYIPNYGEFYEKRWFASSLDSVSDTVDIGTTYHNVPFGSDIICEGSNGIKLACEVCEDLWVNIPPSSFHTAYGANIIANTSASNDIIAKKEYRRDLVRMQSAKCGCAYVYASAGSGESTTDVVYSGHQLIASCGSIIKDVEVKMCDKPAIVCSVVDLDRIEHDRMKENSFIISGLRKEYRRVRMSYCNNFASVLPDKVNPYPFIPSDKKQRAERCKEILNLQATGLATRLKKTGLQKCVIGVSGGLDSTLALLVIKESYDLLGYSYENIIGITMPGFGTTARTKTSADTLMELFGITAKTVDITKCCLQHMEDIGHPADVYDVTYENVQARERTQILMDVANQVGGLVIGTGDLSELALGWCTYNGDHMSMYGVNASVPKTLVKFIIETYAESVESSFYERLANESYDDSDEKKLHDVLIAICETTISPELLPPDENGEIQQSTEQSIGKYDLHDFFLYNYIRNGFEPEKLLVLAKIAFADKGISEQQIEDTLNIFIRRFITNQFKRSCMPDGPKIGSVSLSPRGDWRMPSDFG